MEPAVVPNEQPERRSVIEVDATLVEDISVLIQEGQRGMVLNVAADLRPADLAELIAHLGPDEAWTLFHWLPTELAGEILPELDEAQQQALLRDLSPGHITALVDELDTDDAADILAALPEAIAEQVLPALEYAEDIEELLEYGEDTAGGLMATEYVAVEEGQTIAEVTEEVRQHAEEVEQIVMVYVVDAEGRLKGGIPLKRILLSPADARAGEVMDRDLITVEPEVDQEQVARIMERYDLLALPVVDGEGQLLGRITIDDVVDVIREEAEEDIQRMSGVSGDEETSTSVFRVSGGRLPWLLIGLFGAALSSMVIGTFEDRLEQAIVLATFIPIVTAMGGNAAVQSAAITVQGLSSGDLWLGDLFRRLLKELVVAFLNGVALGLVLIGMVFVFSYIFGFGGEDVAPIRLAATVGLTLFTVVVLATTNGALVPFLLQHLGADPARAMGPFVTTLNDIIGLTVYFVYATMIYLT